jgi:hypothetical protein
LCGGAAQPVRVHIDVDVDVAGSVFDLADQCVDLSLPLCGVGFDVMLAGQAAVYSLLHRFPASLASRSTSRKARWMRWRPSTSSRPSSPASAAHGWVENPRPWTNIDRDYEQIRVNMHTLFDDVALTTPAPLAA